MSQAPDTTKETRGAKTVVLQNQRKLLIDQHAVDLFLDNLGITDDDLSEIQRALPKSLEVLDLSHNQIHDITRLQLPDGLQSLWLSNNPLNADLRRLHLPSSLQELMMNSCFPKAQAIFLPPNDPRPIMFHLTLRDNHIAELKQIQLPSVTDLDIGNNDIQDVKPLFRSGSCLKVLFIDHNPLTHESLEFLDHHVNPLDLFLDDASLENFSPTGCKPRTFERIDSSLTEVKKCLQQIQQKEIIALPGDLAAPPAIASDRLHCRSNTFLLNSREI